MIIDTHAHCYWENIEPHIDEVLVAMKEKRVTHAIQIGCDMETSRKAIHLARSFPGVFFATVGYHPEESQNQEIGGEELRVLENLILENRDVVVAIGETGFDYHYLAAEKDKRDSQIKNQQAWWIYQWELAQKHNLPLVIHTRDARDDTIAFMKEHDIYHAVMHCFSEDWEFARELIEFSEDIYFSFSGILTYKNAAKIQEAAQKIPLDRILIETDSPFLSPQPVRGTINNPSNTFFVLEKLCELRAESNIEIEDVVYQNSRRFYGI